MAKITTLLLDCDNTLVLSESLAYTACADLINDLLRKKCCPRPETYTGPQLHRLYVGKTFESLLHSMQQLHNFALSSDEVVALAKAEEAGCIAKFDNHLQPCRNAESALKSLSAVYELSVVSSSAIDRLNSSLAAVNFLHYFPKDRIFSAKSSLSTPVSKPDPAIYRYALQLLGKLPEECVAVEDSVVGVLSARGAGLRVLGYVGCYENDKGQVSKMAEELTLSGAEAVIEDWANCATLLKTIGLN